MKQFLRFFAIVAILFISVAGNIGYSQVCDVCDCSPTDSKDFVGAGAFLGDINGDTLDPYFECIEGSSTKAYLYVMLVPAGGGVTRYSLSYSFDLHFDTDSSKCYSGCLFEYQAIPGNTPILIDTIYWECGTGLQLDNFRISWQVSASSPCSCETYKGCYAPAESIEIFTPLVPQFDMIAECKGKPFETVSYISQTTGGKSPYTCLWDLGDTTDYVHEYSSLTNDTLVVTYKSPGIKVVTLNVTDDNGISKSHTDSLEVYSCCFLDVECSLDTLEAQCSAPLAVTDSTGLDSMGVKFIDQCGTIVISSRDSTDGLSCPETIIRTYTILDDLNGNGTWDEGEQETSCTQVIIIDDTIPPTFTVPADTTIYFKADGSYDADPEVTGWVTELSDNCKVGEPSYEDSVEDITSCSKVITRTWSLADSCGNAADDQIQIITVADTIVPEIACIDTIICLRPNGFYILSEADKKVLSGYVSDNITSLEELGITVTPDYFTCDQVGEDVPVIITVTDLCGNTSRCTTYVTVCDDIDPVITCIDDVTASADEGACSAVVDFSVEATDNCEANITYSHEPGTEFMVGTTEVWAIATDKAGNADTCMFNVVVTEDEPPVVNCPDDIVIYGTDNESGAMVEFAADATDNCGDAILSYSQESGTYFPVGTTTVTVTATDEAGNTAMCEFDVTVIDDENPPVVDKPAEDVVVHANQETKMPVDSVFNDPDGDDLTIEVSMADGSPVPDWIDLEGDSLVFTPVPADTGCVNVVLTATNMAGASVSDTFEVCVDYANLVDISAGKFEVQLYPNPTPGEVNIDLKPGALREILVTVFDITGKPVLVRNYSPSGRIIFDMTGRATGMYFVRIDFDGHSVLKKLVVERQ